MGKKEVLANNIIDIFETTGLVNRDTGFNDKKEECFEVISDTLPIKDDEWDDVLVKLWEDRNVMFDYLIQLSDSKLEKLHDEIERDFGITDIEYDEEEWKQMFGESKQIKESAEIDPDIEKSIEFNDKYFSRVNLDDKSRYAPIYKYNKNYYTYDKKDCLVIRLFKDDDEIKYLGKKNAPWRELDAVGLRPENWKNVDARDEYLFEYEMDLEEEASYYS